MKNISSILFLMIALIFNLSAQETERIKFHPISHATFVIESGNKTIYVDPIDGAETFSDFDAPDIILITHTHGDHLDAGTVNDVKEAESRVVVPKAVADELGFGNVLNNGEEITIDEIKIEAVPMYNLTEERRSFHPKGIGNGYVLTLDDKRIYISGDTEDIKEMRELKNIDYAFVCMNLPYTMTVERAASAVLDFKPKVVLPYHFRGKGGMSDIDKFTELVREGDDNINVKLLEWYK